MRHLIRHAAVAILCFTICVVPVIGCQAAKMNPAEQNAYDAAIARGDFESADSIRRGAASRSIASSIGTALGFLPAVPDSVKTGAAGLGGIFGASLLVPRTRRMYGQAAMAAVDLLSRKKKETAECEKEAPKSE